MDYRRGNEMFLVWQWWRGERWQIEVGPASRSRRSAGMGVVLQALNVVVIVVSVAIVVLAVVAIVREVFEVG